MKIIKKIIFTILFSMTISVGICEEINFPYDQMNSNTNGGQLDFANTIKDSINEDENLLKQLFKLFMPNREGQEKEGIALLYIKTTVNILLGFVSLIALVMLLYAFYMIFFQKDEAGITKAKQILKGVAIALAIIGFSRLIVSFIFWVGTKKAPEIAVNKKSFDMQNISYINNLSLTQKNVTT